MNERWPRLWIVDPSVRRAEDQGVAEVVAGWTGERRLFRPALAPGDGPDAATGYDTDGVVILGSAASVHDADPWIARLAEWMRPLVAGEVRLPLLGVCFGHQLVAHLAGARVGWLHEDRSKSIGVETSAYEGSRLVAGRRGLRVIVSHREEVKELPAGFRVVASRPGSALDAIEHEGLPIYSVQFHPEAREDFARAAGIAAAEVDDRLREDGQRLLGAFRRVVAARRG